jgi:hypothetical protein
MITSCQYVAEIDIVEGVHDSTENTMSIHTAPGCTMPADYNATGTLKDGLNCDAIATGDVGKSAT